MPLLLESEAKRFKKDTAKFKSILLDTTRAFKYLQADETTIRLLETTFTSEILSDKFLFYNNEPAFIILGHSNYAKAVIANELLHRFIFPIDQATTNSVWRMVRINAGTADKFVLADTGTGDILSSYTETKSRSLTDEMLLEDLQGSETNPAIYVQAELTGVPFLEEGFGCIIPESCKRRSVEEVAQMYADATRGVLPIIIYGFEENNLSSWDLIELTELRRLANDLCFFFAIVPPRDVYESMCVPQLASVKPSRLKPRRVFRGASSVAKAVTSNAKRLTVATPSAHTPSPSILPKPQDNAQPTKGSPGVCGAIDSHCSVQGEEKPCFANHLSSLLLQLGFLSRESTREQSKGTCEDLEYHSRRLSEVVRKPMRSSRRKISLVCSNYPTHFDARLAVETDSPAQTSELCIDFLTEFSKRLPAFVRIRLQSVLTGTLNALAAVVTRSLQGLILQAYDISYELMATPKRLAFARDGEARLYASLLEQTQNRRQQIFEAIGEALKEMRSTLPDIAATELELSAVTGLMSSHTDSLNSESSNSCSVGQSKPIKRGMSAEETGSTASGTCPITDLDRTNQSGKAGSEIVTDAPLRTPSSPRLNNSQGSVLQRGSFFWSFRMRSQTSTSVSSSSKRSNSSKRSFVASARKWRLATATVRNFLLQRLNQFVSERVLDCMEALHNSSIGTLKRVVAELDALNINEPQLHHVVSEIQWDDSSGSYESADEIGEELVEGSTFEMAFRRQSPRHAIVPLSSSGRMLPIGASNAANTNASADPCSTSAENQATIPPGASAAATAAGVSDTEADTLFSASSSSMGQATALKSLKCLLQFSYSLSVLPQSVANHGLLGILQRIKKRIEESLSWSRERNFDKEWVRRTADQMLASLSEARIANDIFQQLITRLQDSHALFSQTLRRLEARAEHRTAQFEESQVSIRRHHAPRLARQLLEIASLQNLIVMGYPTIGREIGRGQFGVVYTCPSWGHLRNLAVKSVVPSDEKHWRELAMEIYYIGQLPLHERIVTLHGCIIDNRYGGGASSAVYMIMDRLVRDLHTALKAGLDWLPRLRVALDVLEGIRFLHSQGLVHRDIKPRNVLLDVKNRAKLTDMGFCKPLPMISGSVLGTPMHMAPEIFDHKYSSSVDVYAFGVLFWYICAGRVHLPINYERFAEKNELWSCVKKGLRPERLQCFTGPCWELMKYCWTSDASKRPHVGVVYENMQKIYRSEVKRAS